ncbi:MAG: hypothetical protein EBT20_04020 [Alphaproteobacteria bacterium]|nr:hypothetical protein [Alphaproteobacteria bacterium]
MDRREHASHFVSAIVILFSLGASFYAIVGNPWVEPRALWVTQNIFKDNKQNFRGFPVYSLDGQGSAQIVGRIHLRDQAAKVELFPDLENQANGTEKLYLNTGSVNILWQLVPPNTKQQINQDLVKLGQDLTQLMKITMQTEKFHQEYSSRLEKLLLRQGEALQQSDEFSAKAKRILRIIINEHAERVGSELGLAMTPHLRAALVDLLTPTFEGIQRFITSGDINMRPLQTFGDKVINDPEIGAILQKHVTTITHDPRLWTLSFDLVSMFSKSLLDDPDMQKLFEDVLADKEFKAIFAQAEQKIAQTLDHIVSQIIGRGPNLYPDPLAIRIIRNLFLQRTQVVAIIIMEDHTLNRHLLTILPTLDMRLEDQDK